MQFLRVFFFGSISVDVSKKHMPELDTTTVVKKSIHGAIALFVRTIFLNLINLIALFVLGIFLAPNVFGVYYIILAVTAFLAYFSDIGLAAALIQKKEECSDDDYKTAFTIQQLLVLIIIIIALASSSFVASFYDLDKPGIFLFQVCVVAFFLSSLKTIPSVILERNLDFQKLVIPQIVETIVFNTTAIVLAVKGFGITSFSFAVLARGIAGLITLYIIRPWRPSIGIERVSAKRLLSYGLPFQSNSVLALIKDDFLTIILGKILTLGEVGFIGFSQRWAYTPLRLAIDNIVRITFPSFSRLQHNPRALKIALEKSLFIILTIVTPLLIGLTLLAPYLVHIIPKYAKWEPALLSLAFFSANALLSSISTPLTNFLNAIGKIKITLLFMIFWTVTTWIATLLAIQVFGFNGVSIASFLVSLSVVAVVVVVRRVVAFNVWKAISAPAISGSIMGTILFFLSPVFVRDFISFLIAVVIGGGIYITILYLLAKNELRRDILLILRILKKD